MSDSPVVQVANIQRPSSGGGLQADLKAIAVGRATVTSGGGVACAPGQPCPMLPPLDKGWAEAVASGAPTRSAATDGDGGVVDPPPPCPGGPRPEECLRIHPLPSLADQTS